MTFQECATLLGNYAFPIVMSFMLLKMNETQDKRHNEQMDALRKSLDNNTDAIERMTVKMEEKQI